MTLSIFVLFSRLYFGLLTLVTDDSNERTSKRANTQCLFDFSAQFTFVHGIENAICVQGAGN